MRSGTVANALNSLARDAAGALMPPPRVALSDWADAKMRLSPEASAAPGEWRCLPYQREPLDCLSPYSPYEEIVLKWASQTGKTSVLLAFLANLICQDPGPTLIVLPTLAVAESFSKDRLAPMFRDVPALRGKVADPRSRDAGSTIYHRQFVGGHLTLVSSNSAAGLASRPIRYLLLDETDRFEASAGAEGNPSEVARKRTATFWNRKIVRCSSPTIPGSEIDEAYRASDQRTFRVPCPLCGELQKLEWARVEWPEGQPEVAAYRCVGCQELIPHHRKMVMLQSGYWEAENPGSRIPGFHLSELFSTARSWGDLAVDWIRAEGNPEKRRVFVNTSLAEVWDDQAVNSVTETELLARRESYGPALPENAVILTAGVDVQGDRVEVSVFAWGVGEESWLMVHRIIPGDPTAGGVWTALDSFLLQPWQHPIAGPVPIHAVGIDSGHATTSVCRFTEERRGRRVWAIKGIAGPRLPWPRKASKAPKGMIYGIGVDSLRSTVAGRMRIAEGGAGRIHLPVAVGQEYVEQLNSEYLETRYLKGRPVREWVRRKGRRAEAWDCAVYALGALYGLASHGVSIDAEVVRIQSLKGGSSPSGTYQVYRSSFMG